MGKKSKFLIIVMLLLVLLGGIFYFNYYKTPTSEEVSQTLAPECNSDEKEEKEKEEEIIVDDLNDQDPNDTLPHDKFFITPERQAYKSGELVLYIPRIDKSLSVYNGVDEKTLLKGVGLYDYSQLPGKGNKNVSIAGHRNGLRKGIVTDYAPFYYIDTIVENDYMYLVHNNSIYRYKWHSMDIVSIDDWSPIYSQGFSCLTLTSCHPIGVSTERIILRGKLDAIFPYSSDFNYLTSVEEE